MDAVVPKPRPAVVRHLFALGLTFAILPYIYGRLLIMGLRGMRDWHAAAIVAVTVAALFVLTRGLRPPLRGLGTLVGWCATMAALLVWAAAPDTPLLLRTLFI